MNEHHKEDTNLVNLNGCMLVAVDIIVSGPKPNYNDLLEVCFLPLNAEFKPHKGILPFNTLLQPKRPENIDISGEDGVKWPRKVTGEYIIKATQSGVEAYTAADRFDMWVDKIKFKVGKKLAPLAHNWLFKREFIISWLGLETFNQCFLPYYRDVVPVSQYLNDYADAHNSQIPFPKQHPNFLYSSYEVDHEKNEHDLLLNCKALGELYKRMLHLPFLYNQAIPNKD